MPQTVVNALTVDQCQSRLYASWSTACHNLCRQRCPFFHAAPPLPRRPVITNSRRLLQLPTKDFEFEPLGASCSKAYRFQVGWGDERWCLQLNSGSEVGLHKGPATCGKEPPPPCADSYRPLPAPACSRPAPSPVCSGGAGHCRLPSCC